MFRAGDVCGQHIGVPHSAEVDLMTDKALRAVNTSGKEQGVVSQLLLFSSMLALQLKGYYPTISHGCRMVVKLLYLWLLFCLNWAQEQRCLQSASSCDECIQAGPGCAWCNSPQAHIRCATTEKLRSTGCHGRHLYNPSGSIQVVKNYSG